MAISNGELYHSQTDNLARLHNFYPTKIAVRHHQLRHLVSVSEGDRIYYVNAHDVYVLDLQAHQSTLLATVLFDARCLAAGYGWVCVGGEQDGNCAFIKLDPELGEPKCFGHKLSVDVLGGDIVNSMNIHLMRHAPDSEPEPIVLISNNDKTLKIFSLAQREVLTTLEHDIPINHAALSPDSELIAAVGDSDKVYFYKRRRRDAQDTKLGHSIGSPLYDWRPLVVPSIPKGDPVYDDYGFAVAFSPSGHLCAASSQGGSITVFDMSTLTSLEGEPEDAILCTFLSSRPTLCGCVRSMAFSPAPWDLLAWAEDHGRIGVADVRQMFVNRQILRLEKAKANTVYVEDMTPPEYKDLELEEKLRQQDLARPQTRRGPISEHERNQSLLHEAQSNLAERRQRRQDVLALAHNMELDARGRSVLEALERTIDNVERSNQPYSVNYTSSPRFRPSSASDFAREYDVQLLNPSLRSGPRLHQPRRRTSVVLSESTANRHLVPSESPRARLSASPGRMTDDDDIPTMSTSDLTPTRGGSRTQPLPYNIPTSDPWHVIQSAMEAAQQDETRGPGTSNTRPASLSQIETAIEAERRLLNQLERQLADERRLSSFLGQQLETQNRLLRTQQQELQAEREAGSRQLAPSIFHEPSWERLLHGELQSELSFGEQRSRELETEVRLSANRVRRLETERSRLLNPSAFPLSNGPNLMQQYHGLGSSTAAVSSQPSPTSAQTSTLPTTNTSFTNRLPTPSAVPVSTTSPEESLDLLLQRHEAYRRQREGRWENLERQIRRAESRVRSASEDIQAFELALQNRTGPLPSEPALSQLQNRDRDRDLEWERHRERIRSALRRTETLGRGTTAQSLSQAQNETPRRGGIAGTELANRVTEAETRVARMMFAGRANLDGNGNWVAGAGLQRVMEQAAASRDREAGNPPDSGTASLMDVAREMGVGTAGISWSTDGTKLFAGSEEGIFEFKVNIKARMTFPAISFR